MVVLVDQDPQRAVLDDLDEPHGVAPRRHPVRRQAPRLRDHAPEPVEHLDWIDVIHLEHVFVPADQDVRVLAARPNWSNSRTSRQDRPSEAKWTQRCSRGVTSSGGRSPGTSRTSTWSWPNRRANRWPSRERANQPWAGLSRPDEKEPITAARAIEMNHKSGAEVAWTCTARTSPPCWAETISRPLQRGLAVGQGDQGPKLARLGDVGQCPGPRIQLDGPGIELGPSKDRVPVSNRAAGKGYKERARGARRRPESPASSSSRVRRRRARSIAADGPP